MKKRLVLIVLLFLVNSFTLLAQNNKTDTTASKNDAAKPLISQTKSDTAASAKAKSPEKQDKKALEKALKQAAQKKQADSIANVKALKIASQKKQADSVANVKALKIASQKKQADSVATAKTLKTAAEKNKKDSIATAKAANVAIQKNKKDSTIKAIKPLVVAQKVKTDSVAAVKVPVTVVKKTKTDSIAAKLPVAPVQKAQTDTTKSPPKVTGITKPDTATHTSKNTQPIVAKPNKTDSVKTPLVPQKKLSKKELAKLAKSNASDSLSTKIKIKLVKPKSAKELKREAKKNDVNNLSEKQLTKLAFQGMAADSSARVQAAHADISFTNARPMPLTEPTSLNIKFFHRYWRDIDLQDPKNKKFAQYHSDLITALLASIKNKQITAYSPTPTPPDNPTGDAFTMPVPYDQLMSGLSDTAAVNILDKDGNVTDTKLVPNPFTPAKISGYRIKEDVFYDKTRSRYITRIIGIAPLVKLTLSTGEVLSIQPLCWLKFKDCRKILVTIDVDPSKKIGDSMDDVFLQRRFYGRIVQESNTEGKRIKDYKTELPDQEAEALRMEKKIVTFKKGSWNYTMLTEPPPPDANSSKPVAKKIKTKVSATPK